MPALPPVTGSVPVWHADLGPESAAAEELDGRNVAIEIEPITGAIYVIPQADTAPIRHVHPGDSLSRGGRLRYILVLGFLTALGSFTIDMYLPAFPTVQRDFHTIESVVQLTLTGTIIGFGLGQLLVGPWTDKIGRKKPLIYSALLHISASILAALAPTIGLLLVARVGQGVGAAAGGVVATAIVRDLFGGKPLVRMLSRLALVNGFAPIFAPLIGSWILLVLPWRGVFWILTAYGTAALLSVILLIRETQSPADAELRRSRSTLQRYTSLFGDRVFIGTIIVSAMNVTALFTYLSGASFLFQQTFHFTAQQFGLLFAVNSVSLVGCVQLASRLMRGRVPPQWVLGVTTAAQLILAIVLATGVLAGGGAWAVIIPLWFFIGMVGATFPAVQVLALQEHPNEAGTAASLMGALNFGVAGIASPLIGLFGTATALPIGVSMAVAAAIALTALWVFVKPRHAVALHD